MFINSDDTKYSCYKNIDCILSKTEWQCLFCISLKIYRVLLVAYAVFKLLFFHRVFITI